MAPFWILDKRWRHFTRSDVDMKADESFIEASWRRRPLLGPATQRGRASTNPRIEPRKVRIPVRKTSLTCLLPLPRIEMVVQYFAAGAPGRRRPKPFDRQSLFSTLRDCCHSPCLWPRIRFAGAARPRPMDRYRCSSRKAGRRNSARITFGWRMPPATKRLLSFGCLATLPNQPLSTPRRSLAVFSNRSRPFR